MSTEVSSEMRVFQPKLLSNNITVKGYQLCPHLSGLAHRVVIGDLHFLLDYCRSLFELLRFLIVIDPKLRKEDLILISRQRSLQPLLKHSMHNWLYFVILKPGLLG